jgi:hypothetical protein
MIRSHVLPVVFALAVPLSAISCDGSEPTTQKDFPLCEAHTTRLVGTIDNMSVDMTLPPAGGGLSQDNAGGEFQYQGNDTSDPTQPDLRLAWDRLTAIGSFVDAHGTLHLVEGTFAGETFCAGSGSRIRMPGGDTVIEFELAGLGSGDNCSVVHTGSVKGCVRY